MIVFVLYLYMNGTSYGVGGYHTAEHCWDVANALAEEGLTADCREVHTQSPLAPTRSLRPVLRGEKQ